MADLNGHKIYVRSQNNQSEEWLTCINEDTFQIDKQVSDSFQISFTAWLSDYDGVSFDMLKNDAYIVFDGQYYVIKQSSPKYIDDLVTKDITATHIAFEVQNFRQFDINAGLQSYSISQMLDYVFKSKYNTEGFTYKVNGSFPTVDITDWGNCSGLDAVQKAVDSYNARWIPDNKVIQIYDESSYKHTTSKQFIWAHNTNDIELSVDSTSIQNAAMLYGATLDEDHSATSDNGSVDGSGDSDGSATSTGNAVGTINTMETGGAPVINSPVSQTPTGRKLPNGSKWLVDKQISIDGTIYFHLGTNEWLNEKYIVFDKNGDVKPESHVIEKVIGQGTIKAAEPDTDSSSDDSGTDTPAPTEANVFDSPWTPQNVTRTLPNGTQWIIDGEVSDGAKEKSWYRVSTSEWVCADDFDFTGDTDVTPQTDDGVADGNTTTDDDSVKYVFDPFFYYNASAVNADGGKMRIGEDITNDQIKDVESMKKYADSVMQVDPIVELTVNLNQQDDELNIGDTMFLNAEPLGLKLMVTLNGISGNPLNNDTPMTISLDNSKLSRKNINFENSDKLRLANRNIELLTKTVRRQNAKLSDLNKKQKDLIDQINKDKEESNGTTSN
ncbi:prophage endopeptidase tail family protein [Companilactobacillus baiquanensis]|uniref:Prophage endopeptidase tail family protein n=2 Tax=Companilactobacillus baiquanensis TaxID=2486005 RepID=A0ABW1UZX4_9LACO